MASVTRGVVDLTWDGRGRDGQRLAAGVYLMRVAAPSAGFRTERKLVVIE